MNIEQLTETVDRLRADLSATWIALGALQSALTPEQQQQVLREFARVSAAKSAIYDAPLPTPEAQAQLSRMRGLAQQAEERVFGLLRQPPPDLRQT